jgi:hypothetical protein
MGREYVEDSDNQFDYSQDWAELVDGVTQPGGGLAMSASSQEGGIQGLVPWNKTRSAVRYFVGYSYCDDGAPYKLYREPPAPHPLMPSLKCQGSAPVGYILRANFDNQEEFGRDVDEVIRGQNAPYVDTGFQDYLGNTIRTAYYHYSILQNRYKSYGMTRFLPDADIDNYLDEWKRYVSMEFVGGIEALQADNAALLAWRETSTDPGLQPVIGEAFPTPLAQLQGKSSFVMTWMQVPHDYISTDPTMLYPEKMLKRLGKWNSDNFLGFRKGQLLFLALEAEPMLFPVLANDPVNGIPLCGYNLKFHFSYFDPPKGNPSPPAGQTEPIYGHRLNPWRASGKYFWATRPNSSSELLPGESFWPLFAHVDDPSAP